jgi:hypothetical protein
MYEKCDEELPVPPSLRLQGGTIGAEMLDHWGLCCARMYVSLR